MQITHSILSAMLVVERDGKRDISGGRSSSGVSISAGGASGLSGCCGPVLPPELLLCRWEQAWEVVQVKKWVPLNVIEKRGSDCGHVRTEVVKQSRIKHE